MIDTRALHAVAAAQRATQARVSPLGLPADEPARSNLRFQTHLATRQAQRDGSDLDWAVVEGYASVYERGYEMWDWYGPYTEIVSAGAATKTLAASPMVVYRFNHAGMAMANTRNGRLELWEDETGLGDRAWLNPTRADVQQLITAIRDGDVTEQSFMFRILQGQWSPDYTEYRITEVDLDRGDVGPVTYGASPTTSVAARSGELLAALQHMPPLAARAALQVLGQRADLAANPTPAIAPATAGDVAMLALRLGLSD